MTVGRCLLPQYKQAAFRNVFSRQGQVSLVESTGISCLDSNAELPLHMVTGYVTLNRFTSIFSFVKWKEWRVSQMDVSGNR